MESSSNNDMIQPLIFLYMYLYTFVPEFFPTAKQGTFGQPLSAFLLQRATMKFYSVSMRMMHLTEYILFIFIFMTFKKFKKLFRPLHCFLFIQFA